MKLNLFNVTFLVTIVVAIKKMHIIQKNNESIANSLKGIDESLEAKRPMKI